MAALYIVGPMLQRLKQTEIIAGLIIILVLGIGAIGALQSREGLLRFEVEGNVAYGNGYTDDRSGAMMQRFFRQNPQVDTLVFEDMPGTKDADMNLWIARQIRARDLKTVLTERSYIASGAVDLFLAGAEREAACGARIGVHSWSAGPYIYPARSGFDGRQGVQEAFLAEMGIPTEFYAFTRDQALPNEIYVLSPDEIARFGLLTTPQRC